ncbi:hypothetical protein AAZX31_11G090800 [Glycine max]|uniref:Serine/threonine-protein phosphatase 4 regulatory subunit 2 n=1 Tax=Glycine max TaxID=3847 RepID=C6TEN3_SOYBN|nr:uncharacterized protein LOC100803269 [Glycine max]XP_028186745.1 serine/threonine-protein phosphatase 4 regulatory subunit 2-like [Glycine soja]ACU20285.1 unknown [Glycine max]KAH1158303.1 hypothetical protein GYH30_030513 [Glycine max]KHN05523.1 Serine/threonine-protein phosphatase 4 regulatory subunit 2 [Glycine soja]KRH29027.1 hypothetical protein GLYMA_11G092500v4 [Glycine max]|eukprot:NP_001241323.1 uncharacterized protein LOC100803269 [Glycine max]
METQSHEDLQQPPPVTSNEAHSDDASDHRDAEQKQDILSTEEVVQILQVVASTGRFWHDWDKLKSMLSFQLKQVLSEYPEAKMTSEQQYASLGESYIELVNKLDEALTCFIEGPPFTLQRLCEILLDAKGIYPNLSKLALALEKNLLVTSTLTICTDPYPQATEKEPDDQEKASEKQQQQQQSDSAQNGIEPLVSDNDEVMPEADVGDDMTIDMEAFEGVKSSEINSEPNANNA